MAKCPNCQEELVERQDGRLECPQCQRLFKTVKHTTDTAAPTPREPEQQNPRESVNEELELLKARLAILEAEKQQASPSSAKKNFLELKQKVVSSSAWAWLKKYGLKIVLPSVLVVIIFITLVSCLAGIRGIYVNVNNPNEFFSFTATKYEYHGQSVLGDYIDKGTWKKSGNKLLLTYKDEDFGKITEENIILSNKSNKTLVLEDELGMEKTYKRVSLIDYSVTTKKAHIVFDSNGGYIKESGSQSQSSQTKITTKIGNKIDVSFEAVNDNKDVRFMGWFTEPYGFKSENSNQYIENRRVWESVTYYANWYNTKGYDITIYEDEEYGGNKIATVHGNDGDLILDLINRIKDGFGYSYDTYKIKTSTWDGREWHDTFNDITETSRLNKDYTIIAGSRHGRQFTAHFNAEGGNFSLNQQQFTYNDGYILPLEIPTKENFKFGGWYIEDGGAYCCATRCRNVGDLYFNAYWYTDDIFEFEKSDQSETYVLTGYKDKDKIAGLEIPSSYNGLPISSIKDRCFYSNNTLQMINIPDSVTYIGDYAFSGCTELIGVLIDGITSIDEYAFSGCTSLIYIIIPNGVASIGRYAFSGCTNLQYNKYNNALYLGTINNPYAILIKAVNKSITSCLINENTEVIANYAFEDCTSLTSTTIPDSVTSIGNGAFSNCEGLQTVYYTGNIAKWCEISFYHPSSNPLFYANNLYLNGELVTDIVIPDDCVTSIGDWAFYGCTGLTSVTIGNGVTSIGYNAFSDCTGLTSVTIGNGVTDIDSYAFYGCTGLSSVTIGNSVTDIGSSAFSGCTSLTSITIPDSVTYIRSWAFFGCTGLVSVTIGNGVTSIGDRAFDDCRIVEVYNNSSLNITKGSSDYGDVGKYAKDIYTSTNQQSKLSKTYDGYIIYTDGEVKSLITYVGSETQLALPSNITEINQYAFNNCTSLTSITIPDSVTSIGYNAFSGCTGLTSVTIGNSVTYIGYNAFYGCTGLSSVTIGNDVTDIDSSAFSGCTSLTSITIPDSVTYIRSWAFSGCTGLTSVTIGNGVTYIGSYVFNNCTSLTSITIPNSVTSIRSYAFDGCTGLTIINYNGTKEQWKAISKNVNLSYQANDIVINCTDGKLDKNGNEI